MAADGSVIIEIKGDADEFEQEIKGLKSSLGDAEKSTRSFGDVFKGTIAGNLVIGAVQELASNVGEIGTQMVESAAAVKAQASQFEQTFGDLADTAQSAISDVADSSGILDTRLKGVGTSIYAFARASGGETEEAMSLMQTALQATADAAAYYDRSLEDTAESLQSFLKGNYENDAALGLSATETTRNAAAMELFGQKFKDLSEIQKQQTLLQMVVDAQELSGAMGQAAREADGWENVTGNLQESWSQFLALVGTPVLQGVIPLVQNLTGALSGLSESINWQAFNDGVASVFTAVEGLLSGDASGILELVSSAAQWASTALVNAGAAMRENLPNIISIGLEMISGIAATLRENVGLIVDGAISLAIGFAQGLADSIPTIIEKVPEIVSSIANTINDNAPKIVMAAVQIIGTLVSGLISAIPTLIANIPAIISAIVDTLLAFNWVNLGGSIIKGLGNGLKSMLSFVKNVAKQVVDAIKGGVSTLPTAMTQIGKNIVQGLWNGIKSMISWIKGKAKEFVGGLVGGIKDALGINSPSRVMRDEVGRMIPRGVAVGISKDTGKAVSEAQALSDELVKASMPDINNAEVMNKLRNAVQTETMRFSAGLALSSNSGDAARTAANMDAMASTPGWDGIEEIVAELRSIKRAVEEGKVLSVNGRVLGRVAQEYIGNEARAQGA